MFLRGANPATGKPQPPEMPTIRRREESEETIADLQRRKQEYLEKREAEKVAQEDQVLEEQLQYTPEHLPHPHLQSPVNKRMEMMAEFNDAVNEFRENLKEWNKAEIILKNRVGNDTSNWVHKIDDRKEVRVMKKRYWFYREMAADSAERLEQAMDIINA